MNLRKSNLSTILVILITVIIVVFTSFTYLLTRPTKMVYKTVEGILMTKAYPPISEFVPTLMVYCLHPAPDEGLGTSEIYLTEDGKPLGALEGFSEGEDVKITGVLYTREKYDGGETYIMLEIFEIKKT
jgi:hypothetical protein